MPALPLALVLTALPVRADDPATGEVVLRGVPLTVTSELELQAGLAHGSTTGLALPWASSLLVDATTARRDEGALADLLVAGDPLAPEAAVALRGFEIFRRDPLRPLEYRVGRLGLVHGGRFRFVDGADLTWRAGWDLRLSAWGGEAWHPERAAFASGGPAWGLDAVHRSARPLGGGLRYEHVAAEDGGGVERIGADAGLHLDRVAGLRVDARVDAVVAEEPLELAALSAELRPLHRLHLALEGGESRPTKDALGRGGALGSLLTEGPTAWLEGSARVALPESIWTLDLGGLALTAEDGAGRAPGWRAALSRSGRAGAAAKHVVRLSGLGGPGGRAAALLVEVGREVGPLDVSILGEQAAFGRTGESTRLMSVGAARVATEPTALLRLSLLGQVSVGQGTEQSVWLVATRRLVRGRPRGPAPTRDRHLSPWSPWRWVEDDMPRSPGTVPGADPYPSVPIPPHSTAPPDPGEAPDA